MRGQEAGTKNGEGLLTWREELTFNAGMGSITTIRT